MMNRLLRPLLLALIVGLCAAGSALAQFRTLPQNAKLARTGEALPLPLVQLDGKNYKLAPGGVIYDQNNRTVLHGQLPAGARVAYLVDMGGDIGRIYVLSAQEVAQIDSKK
jgi:hypothetical protein